MAVLSSHDLDAVALLKALGGPPNCKSFTLRMAVDEVVIAEAVYYPDELSKALDTPVLAEYRLVAIDDAALRAKFAEILSPAVNCEAPYAKVVLDQLVEAVMGRSVVDDGASR